MAEWKPTPSGFAVIAGGLDLAVTDQSYRGCGWCWHVSLTEPDRNGEIGEIAGGAGKDTADEAKAAAEQYAAMFCKRTLDALDRMAASRTTTSKEPA
jgi:hypothetical protein